MITDPNLVTYEDPINYDHESSEFEPDGSILLEFASQASGPVLELGCGTGRVAIPLSNHWATYHQKSCSCATERK